MSSLTYEPNEASNLFTIFGPPITSPPDAGNEMTKKGKGKSKNEGEAPLKGVAVVAL